MTQKIFNSLYYWCNIRNLDIDEIAGLIQSESRGNSRARSNKGAIGLLQVMPFHLPSNSLLLYVIDKNIEIGTKYYKWCKNFCKGNINCSLKTYNAGPMAKEYKNFSYIQRIKKDTSFTRDCKKKFYNYLRSKSK